MNGLYNGGAVLSPRESIREICVSLYFYLQSHRVAAQAPKQA